MGEEEGFMYQCHHQLLACDSLYPARSLFLSMYTSMLYVSLCVHMLGWVLAVPVIWLKWWIWVFFDLCFGGGILIFQVVVRVLLFFEYQWKKVWWMMFWAEGFRFLTSYFLLDLSYSIWRTYELDWVLAI